MEASPTFPSNKRHAMFFHPQSPPRNMITAQFPDPKSGHLSPSNVSISAFHTPDTIEEALALTGPPAPPAHRVKNIVQPRQPLDRSQSSEYFLEIKKSPSPRKEPRSRKTDSTTIRTDATESQPAFESDAFAVQMPTTREPIMDPPIFRAKLPTPSKAQVDAYQTYKEKARQVRERNNSQGVRVPSKIVSYDYACATKSGHVQAQPLQLDLSPPSSPPTTAGSFPTSPPATQHVWARPKQAVHIQGPRSMSESSNISIARKPVGLGNATSHTTRPFYQRDDAETGASHSTPSPTPTKIKLKLKPKTSSLEADRPQKESWWSLYNRTPQVSSSEGSRSPSPTKAMANFAFTSPPVTGDNVFGYRSHDISGTAASTPSKKEKERAKKPSPKRNLASRWAWLRPAGPRVNKPTATQISSPVTVKATTYVDPFVLHETPTPTLPGTPTVSRPASPKKLARSALIHTQIPENGENGKFDTGFAQVKGLTSLILKICLLVYALVGLYFILDAVREAVHALGAPFRLVRILLGYVWIVIVWAAKTTGKGWERWGFKVALGKKWRGG